MAFPSIDAWRRRLSLALLAALSAVCSTAAETVGLPLQPRTVADINALLDGPGPAPPGARQLPRDEKPPDTADRRQLARFYKARAAAAEEAGIWRLYAEYMREVVKIEGDDADADDLVQLANAEMGGGNFRSALSATELALAKIPPGTNPGKRRSLYQFLRRIHTKLGDLPAAEEAERRAQAEFKFGLTQSYASLYIDSWTVANQCSRAEFFLTTGKLDDARASFQQCVDGIPRWIAEAQRNRPAQRGATYQSDTFMRHRGFRAQAGLAEVLLEQGRLTEAEAAARAALSGSVRESGRDSVYTAILVGPMVQVLLHQGRFAEAQHLAAAGLRIAQAVGAPTDATWALELHGMSGMAAVGQDRYADGLAAFDRGRAAMTEPAQSAIMPGGADWALALLEAGRPAEAESMVQQSLDLRRPWLGNAHVDIAELEGLHAMSLAARGDLRGAVEGYRHALPVLLAAAAAQSDEPSALRSHRLERILEAFIDLLGTVNGSIVERDTGIDAVAEAFRVADALRSRSTQGAVAASAVRAAAHDPALAGDMRKEQDLAQELAALHRILREQMAAPASQRLPQVTAAMQARVKAIQAERAALAAGISARFPTYASLLRPSPPTLAEARAALRPGESLLSIYSTTRATYVWAFRRDGAASFAVHAAGRDAVARRVRTLRLALDPGDIDVLDKLPRFDLALAHGLYSDLLAPVAPGWQGSNHLLVASNGALTQLPLAILPTAATPAGSDSALPYAGMREVSWLIRQAALTQLPSVHALLTLRRLPPPNERRLPFVGYGDPQFALAAAQVRASTRALRSLEVPRPGADDLNQAKPVEWMDYAKIPALPDTRDEILSLARALKADPQRDVFLGERASRASVKSIDLSSRRVVAFATHGLLAGDFPGVQEPSLALANPGGGQHGLLTLEDILGLKLDADWVVLSACNTASGDGKGAEALSGLARGFFYAGSRALLVTHWPVESASARLLVTDVFERQAADPLLGRAEALRQAMLAMMQRSSDDASPRIAYAHPLFWAPYVVVGEGGR